MLHVTPLSPRFLSREFFAVTVGLAAFVAAGCQRAADPAPVPGGPPAVLASAALTDQEGQARQFGEFQGKTVVLDFFFASCPSVCPRETRDLAEVQRRLSPELARRVQFLSLTVDPGKDTPQGLKAFARANGADLSGWSFVRASGSTTTALTKELGVFSGPSQAQVAPAGHGTSVYLFDGRGRLMQRYAGSPLDVARLAREIEQLDGLFRKHPV